MKVYHGGIQEIRTPLAKVGRCKYYAGNSLGTVGAASSEQSALFDKSSGYR